MGPAKPQYSIIHPAPDNPQPKVNRLVAVSPQQEWLSTTLCGAYHIVSAKSGITIAEWPETPTWKPLTAVACIALISATALIWQNHKTKATELKLAADAKACRVRAEQGDAKAESDMGRMYSQGQGVSQDYDEALRWRRKAADQGNVDGEDGLGYMYLYGLGVPRDYTEALRWYHKAADQGDAKAQSAIGSMYYYGRGIPQDPAEAANWYRKAADQGLAKAEYDLGYIYEYGRGVPQDRVQAVRWYQKAADQGDEYAQQVLHIKWKGMSKFGKVTISIVFLGNALILIGSVKDWRSSRGPQQRTFFVAALFGFSYLALDLLGFRYIGILTPVLSVGAFSLVKSLLSGTFLALLLSVVLPNSLWPKVAKVLLGISCVLFIGHNGLAITVYEQRHAFPTLRSFWLINGMLLGMSAGISTVLWLKGKSRREDPIEAADLQPPIPPMA
ncbi:MAG: tetratricopeptide repeat protein [Terracidiphilus sp.]